VSSEHSNREADLPPGWERVPLREIAETNPGLEIRIENEDQHVNFVPMRAVEPEGAGLLRPEIRTYGEVKKGYTIFRSGDVIMAKITPCMENGKTTAVPELPDSICFGSTEFHVIRPETGIDPRWISNFLLQHEVRRAAKRSMAGGVGQMRVPGSFVASLGIPVPPRAEVQRIFAELDELFPDLDNAVRALENVQKKLPYYKAAVLKAAVEGKLTSEWREQHPNVEPGADLLKRILAERRRQWEKEQLRNFTRVGKEPPKNWEAKYREPVVPDTTTLHALPAGWSWASLDQLGHIDRGRSKHRPRNAAFLYGGPYPFIQTGDIRRARQYLREHFQTYSEAGLQQSRLWPKDTLCITIAANIAETAILSYPACFPDSIVGVVFQHSLVSVRYVEIFIRSVKVRINFYAPATAQKNINNEILRSLAVALPPLQEQEEIVNAVEEQFSVIEHLESILQKNIDAARSLRQATLKSAFRGELVSQNAKDEPASELLKRIAAEREERARIAKAAKTAIKNGFRKLGAAKVGA